MSNHDGEGSTVDATCAQCKRPTQHSVLKGTTLDEDNEYMWCRQTHQIIQCMGCKNVCFREVILSSEETDWDGAPIAHVKIFPDPAKRNPAVESWKLPKHVRSLYMETLTCFDAKAMTLSAAGLRSVVEATCIDQGCTSSNLKDKIDELISKGVLLKRDADYLHQHRFLGNEAVHELEAPPSAEFVIALTILEHLLTTVYILPELAADLVALRKKRGAQTQ